MDQLAANMVALIEQWLWVIMVAATAVYAAMVTTIVVAVKFIWMAWREVRQQSTEQLSLHEEAYMRHNGERRRTCGHR